MIRTTLLLLISGLFCIAQDIVSWDVGTAAPLQGFLPDPCPGGSTQIPTANQQTVSAYNAEYKTFRWGSSISCQLFGISGPGTLTIEYEEPTVTGPGQRLMTFVVNYVTQPPVDIFAKCGMNVQCSTVVRTFGPILLTCTANGSLNKPNCLIMGLKWAPDPPIKVNCIAPIVCPFDPNTGTYTIQYQSLPSPPTATLKQCSGVTGTNSDCTGLYFFGPINGSMISLIGTVAPSGFVPSLPNWVDAPAQ